MALLIVLGGVGDVGGGEGEGGGGGGGTFFFLAAEDFCWQQRIFC